MYLLDTNVFLEILLKQEKSEECKLFLKTHINSIFITDFALHSIGVILFRHKKHKIYADFIKDILCQIRILSLPASEYQSLIDVSSNITLDFDDLYQYIIAKYFDLQIVTMDSDFKIIKDIKIHFL
ncbi:MAG: PIN domain-containing protein [Thermodesulfobacteriota bacterium]|nr:PIN domain-containing protein [Thermodesulfobacteriota bacterium]